MGADQVVMCLACQKTKARTRAKTCSDECFRALMSITRLAQHHSTSKTIVQYTPSAIDMFIMGRQYENI